MLFRCNWWDVHDTGRGVRLLKGNDPFILASQASQVFYCDDIASKGWLIAVKVQPRDVYDISVPSEDKGEVEDHLTDTLLNADVLDEVYQERESFNPQFLIAQSSSLDTELNWRRDDVESDVVNISKSR